MILIVMRYENTLLLPSFPIDASFIDNLCPFHPDIISIHPFLRKFLINAPGSPGTGRRLQRCFEERRVQRKWLGGRVGIIIQFFNFMTDAKNQPHVGYN